jgi:opacity protein-like surface antigen
MRKLTLCLFSTLLLAGTASANDVYDRSFENGISVYRGVTVHPDVAGIQLMQQRQAQAAAQMQAAEQRAQDAREKRDLMIRQTEALEDIADSVDALSRRRGYGSNIGYGYGFGGGFGFNGLLSSNFPQTGGRVRLNAPGALRPRVVPGSGGVRF